MQHQRRSGGQCIDPRDDVLEGPGHVRAHAGRAEADVAIADLNERKALGGYTDGRAPQSARQGAARQDTASGNRPENAGASPRHTLEEAATVDPVMLVIFFDMTTQ